MEIPNITLSALVKEIAPRIEKKRVVKVQELPSNWLKITLQGNREKEQLIVGSSAIFVTQHSISAKKQTSGFGAFLNKRLKGMEIAHVEQHGFDRVVVFSIEKYALIVEVFAKGNIALVQQGVIESAYRKEVWKDRELKKGSVYRFPASKGMSPLQIDQKQLLTEFAQSERDCIRALIKHVNIAPIIAEHVFSVSRIAKETPARSLSAKQVEKVVQEIERAYTLAITQPRMIGENETIIPFPLAKKDKQTPIPSINGALDDFFAPEQERVQSVSESKQDRRVIALEKSLEQQKNTVQKFELQSEEYRTAGEYMYTYYQGIQEALRKPTQDGMYTGGVSVKKIDQKKKKILVELP
jgi:predicted ribosome quality control (RQC) complex YloA/Tae2 family protein